MSTHPNVILMAILTPDGLARKTMREIWADYKKDEISDDIAIGLKKYHTLVMESDYDDEWQISSKEGDLLFFDLVTYGYGESVTWNRLEAQKIELELWAKEACIKYNCSYEIVVTANYW